MYTSGIFKNTT